MSGRRLLVLSWDPVTETMAGPAIRAWHLALELAGEHEVVLAGTRGATRSHPALQVEATDDPSHLRELLDWCDAVVAPNSLIRRYPFFGESDKPLCIDLYCPTHLENLASGGGVGTPQNAAEVAHQVSLLNEDLGRADFILCASERQRDFWLGALGALGRLNPANYEADPTLRSLIDVVPFGLDPSSAPAPTNLLRDRFPAIGASDPVLVWGGGVYDWFDPLSLVRAVASLVDRRPNVRLVFLGMRNPNPEIPDGHMESRLRQLAEDLGLAGTNVFFNEGWIPYADRGGYLAGADCGVSSHPAHIETHFSFRTRILDYLWAGLPTVLAGGDTLSEAVAAAGVGMSSPPGDVESMAAAIDRILHSPPSRQSVLAFGRTYAWPVVAVPLTAWASDPWRAADHPRLPPPPAAWSDDHSPAPGPVATGPQVVARLARRGFGAARARARIRPPGGP